MNARDVFTDADFARPLANPTFEDFMDPEKRAMLIEQTKLEIREAAMVQVRALMAVGWKVEFPDGDTEPWQWQWRRPPRRAGSKGMFFWSTNQAYNSLTREKKAGATS